MTYVLILVIMNSYGIAVTTAEFATREKCEAAAGAAAEVSEPWARKPRFVCVEK